MRIARAKIGADHFRIFDDFLRVAFGDFLPVVEHHDMFRHRHDGAHQMLDDDDGEAAARQLADQSDSLVDLRRIEPRHHFVKQQQPRLRGQCPRHFKAALVDGREIAGSRCLARGQTNEIDGLARLGARAIGASLAQEGAGHHVIEDGHAAERFCNLKGARKPVGADVMRPQADHLLTESGHRAGIGPVKPHDEIEGGRLAGAVRTDQRQRFVFTHGEADILHGAKAAETLVEVGDDECVRHGVTPSPACDGDARRLRRGSP